MVDFHTHILSGMDDGSQSIEESVQMLEQMREQGIRAVAATPHFDMRQETLEHFLMRRENALEELKRANTTDITILPGAEVLYCGVSLHRYENLEQACIGTSRYLLIETLYPEWTKEFQSDLECLMIERNIIPVLAHVDRYYHIRKNRSIIRNLSQEGVVLQVNAGALLHKKRSHLAWKILKKETVGLIGSDCHNISVRPPNLADAAEKMKKVLGTEKTSQFFMRANTMLQESI